MRITELFAPIPLSVLARTDLSGNGKLIYARLLLYAGVNGQAFPSQETLSEEVGISTHSVKRGVAELAGLGLITRKQRGYNQSNTYTLVPTPLVEQICTAKGGAIALLDSAPAHPLKEHLKITTEKKEAPKRGTRIKEDWRPGEGCLSWCQERTTQDHIEAAIETFVDHWLSASGRPAVKRDWDAAFRNWIRNDIKWDRHKSKSNSSVHAGSTANTERRRAGLAAAFEQRVAGRSDPGTVH